MGHVISSEGMKPDPEKIKAVIDYTTPTVRNVREALGFIEELLDQIYQPFHWGAKQEQSFRTLQKCLVEQPVLIYIDFNEMFTLTTNASNFAIGAVLSQKVNGFYHPIAYLSRALNKAEQNYCLVEKESLAALHAMNHFRPYLLSKKFVLQSDCEPLNYMHNGKDPGQRLLCWIFKFTDYTYDFKYRAGSLNTNANAMSRNPP